ncbi:MAG: hypothetical protein HQL76_06965 [Magnetococcales bacterium]|nr:hypothetical protein [Magnetococcales bacterium]
MSTESSPIRRIKEVTLSHFRGFVGENHTLNLDADVVLISGFNGSGKSSLLSALQLLLTGYHPFGSDKDCISFGFREEAQKERQTRIEARVALDHDVPGTVSWTSTKSHLVVGLPDGRLGTGNQELKARLSCFFQDRVDWQFDKIASGKTLRDVLEPLPEHWGNLVRVMNDNLKKIADTRRSIGRCLNNADAPSRFDTLNRLIVDSFSPIHTELRQRIPELPAWVNCTDFSTLAAWTRDYPKRQRDKERDDPERFMDRVSGWIETAIEDAKRKAGTDSESEEVRRLLKQKNDLERAITDIKEKYPRLDEEVSHFEAISSGLPGALEIFDALAENAQRWAKANFGPQENETKSSFPPGLLVRVFEELDKVQKRQADDCATSLRNWLAPRRTAKTDLSSHEKELMKIEDKLAKVKISEELERLDELRKKFNQFKHEFRIQWQAVTKQEAYREKRKALELAETELASLDALLALCVDQVRETPSKPMMTSLTEHLNDVLIRFSMVEGIYPMTLEPMMEPSTEDDTKTRRSIALKAQDGREIKHLSTGQKAQAAVAFLVAQNVGVTPYLAHRVILLDDLTTPYDLANLTRESLLWRQLAYVPAGVSSYPQDKRQIILSSHHEDLTNNLLDLLVPPEGGTMRLLRFTDWSPTKGPSVEEMSVMPTGSGQGESRQRFVRMLERYPWSPD